MKKSIAALAIAYCLSAHGQFFSAEEKAAMEKTKKTEIKTSLPESEQRAVYIELCTAETTAEAKASNMYPVKILQTPDKREAQQQKADKTKASLLKLYKEELAKKHNIAEAYLDQIETAGKKNQWPKSAGEPVGEP